jgi:hypothetical protein
MRPILILQLMLVASLAAAEDWLTRPGRFSHDDYGARVTQYAPIAAPAVPSASNFISSGYTHTTSSLNFGGSSDNYHQVEEWGAPVRPYGEWQFPYRPFSTPYSNWAPPFAGLNLGYPFPYGGGFGGGQGWRPPNNGSGANRWRNPGFPGSNFDGGFLGRGAWPSDRSQWNSSPAPTWPFTPFPIGPGSANPLAPY